jgi:8-oxo-dGTP pyrophosphatase MutT (NUDIX family)
LLASLFARHESRHEAPDLGQENIVAFQHTLRRWRDHLTLQPAGDAVTRQFGAIPYTVLENRTVFLIITSRRTGRWIFPKGGPVEGLTPWQVAAREALEEAGAEGEIETSPIGAYRDMKSLGIRRMSIEVDLYPLRLVRQLDDWPEKGSRHRHWVILPEAKRLLSNPRMAELAAVLDRRVGPETQPVAAAITQ